MLTAPVLAVSILMPLFMASSYKANTAISKRADFQSIFITTGLDKRETFEGIGGLLIIPGSFFSKASVAPRNMEVVILIQRICKGISGSARPNREAIRITPPSVRFVGMVQVMNLIRLSILKKELLLVQNGVLALITIQELLC